MSGQNQRGVSLIEILVSIVIVCFGLLGVAGLLTTGLKSTQVSQIRTQASFLAYDMADRMRTNRQVALNGEYTTATTASNATAVADKADWKTAVETLPGGSGTVAMNNTFFTITIQWDDSKLAGGSATQQFVFVGEL
ncbi:type IV pilus modification protein PilV [Ferribacterium limneticum]|uniref:type IV pilus modification protein PilV n=1 Tax=Ferribacterium limneticum TaxID=76259 RepID=UPI001CFBC43F|nr:type IV pilus modification protein PilV [Ferribacterium limneticum]